MVQRALTAAATAAGVLAISGMARASWTLTTINNSSDCGSVNSIAIGGTTLHMAWICKSGTTTTIKYAKGTAGGTSFPVQTIDSQTSTNGGECAVMSDGTVAFTSQSGYLKFARPVTAGTGNCPNNNNWSCETVDSTDFTWSPAASVAPDGTHYITFSGGSGFAKSAHRTGINSYTFLTLYSPPDDGYSASNPFVDASNSTAGVWYGWTQDALGVVSAVTQKGTGNPGFPCTGCAIDTWHANSTVNQPEFLTGDTYYIRQSGGGWFNQDYATGAEWTALSDSSGYAVISRGGSGGLILTSQGVLGGWEDTLVDGSVSVNATSIVTNESTNLSYIAYYDSNNTQLKLASQH